MKGGKISEIYINVLQDLKKVEGVKTIAFGSRNGFLIGEYADDESETLALTSADMLRAAEVAIIKLEKVSPDRMIVHFNGGKLIAATAGPKALISLIAAEDANLETIISELERTAGKIKEII